jgi:hypothetical protein
MANSTLEGRPATAGRGSSRRLIERRLSALPIRIGWDRPAVRPPSQCPVCWAPLYHLAWAEWCDNPVCRAAFKRDAK